jgi:hypothetical protein
MKMDLLGRPTERTTLGRFVMEMARSKPILKSSEVADEAVAAGVIRRTKNTQNWVYAWFRESPYFDRVGEGLFSLTLLDCPWCGAPLLKTAAPTSAALVPE